MRAASLSLLWEDRVSDLPERLRVNTCRYAHETKDQAAKRRLETDLEAASEIERLQGEVRHLRIDNARLRDEAFARTSRLPSDQ